MFTSCRQAKLHLISLNIKPLGAHKVDFKLIYLKKSPIYSHYDLVDLNDRVHVTSSGRKLIRPNIVMA